MPSTALFVNKPRLFAAYPGINYLTNGAGHQYNAMTAEVKRRGTQGLTYQLSYTLARDIGDLERAQSPENAYDRRRERGPWLDVPGSTITGNVIYELPLGHGKNYLSNSRGWVNQIVGGWSTALIYTHRSGRFLTPQWTGNDPTGTAYTTAATPASVTIRPNILSNPNLDSDKQTVSQWFNPAAFGPPTPGSYGTSGPGVIVGPSLTVFDAGVFKVFPVRERFRIRAEITVVNALNHPNYNDPATNISSAGTVGAITGVGGLSNISGAGSPLDPGAARAFRTGLRLEF